MLRFTKFDRVPDVIIYPSKHEDVEAVVMAAHKHNVVIIPFAGTGLPLDISCQGHVSDTVWLQLGGTSVSQALLCPANELRMIVSLDMRKVPHVNIVM